MSRYVRHDWHTIARLSDSSSVIFDRNCQHAELDEPVSGPGVMCRHVSSPSCSKVRYTLTFVLRIVTHYLHCSQTAHVAAVLMDATWQRWYRDRPRIGHLWTHPRSLRLYVVQVHRHTHRLVRGLSFLPDRQWLSHSKAIALTVYRS